MSERVPFSQLLDDLRAGEFSEEDIPAVLRCLADAFVIEAEADIEELVAHDSPEVRTAAVDVLAMRWRIAEYRPLCEYLLRYDEDAGVRSMAARGLGALLSQTRDKTALRQLLEAARNPREARRVRQATYLAALDVIGATPVRRHPARFSLRRDVDWHLVDDLLKESGQVLRCTICGTPMVRPGDGPEWCLDCTLDVLEFTRVTAEATQRRLFGRD